MIYGLIIAAGKQSRFEVATPKALMPYKDTTLLDTNIKNMKSVCDKVYVVTSDDNTQWFTQDDKLVINSGYGCGDAVMRALALLELNEEDTVFIQWGDCLHTKDIYQDLVKVYSGKWLIPCVTEDKPYVQIIPEENRIHVSFSKYGDTITSGYHDLSLFYGNAIELQKHLVSFADSIKSSDPSTKYKHPHGNEMQFLDVFNDTTLQGQVVEYMEYNTFAFNTIDEFNQLVSS